MSTTVPDLQVFVSAGGAPIAVASTDLEAQLEAGKIRLDLIGGEFIYSQGPKVVTFSCTAPALPDGLQVDAWGAIVDEQDAEVTIFMAGGKSWKGTGVFMNTGITQSASSAQTQTFTIELPLTRKPK